ncbi:MAG: metallophosphatase family protein [Turicibacter sp.]|nr:metallophosphatase family protein [Turicibacter sp.]
MEKIAVLSDIHGNLTAFNAVLDDAEQVGATHYLVLGDLLMPGPGSGEILDKIKNLPNVRVVRGNWDDCLLNSRYQEVKTPQDRYLARLGKYHVDKSTDFDYLGELPLAQRFQIKGVAFSICHNLPHKNFGGELFDDSHLVALFPDSQVQVALHEHTHYQRSVTLNNGRLVINPGSVGHRFLDEHRQSGMANYAVLSVDNFGGVAVQLKEVDYDVQTEKEFATASGLPYLPLYLELLESGRTFTHDGAVLEKFADN